MLRSLIDVEHEALRRRDELLSNASHARLVRQATARAATAHRPSPRPPARPIRAWRTALDTTGLLLEHWGRALRTTAAT